MSGYDTVYKLITRTGNTNNWSRKKAVAETSQTNILVLYRVSTTKAQPVTMIDKSEIKKTGKFFSQLFLLCSAGFLKNQLPPPLTIILEILLSFQKRGRGIVNYVNL